MIDELQFIIFRVILEPEEEVRLRYPRLGTLFVAFSGPDSYPLLLDLNVQGSKGFRIFFIFLILCSSFELSWSEGFSK